jgi:hypothetical protein
MVNGLRLYLCQNVPHDIDIAQIGNDRIDGLAEMGQAVALITGYAKNAIAPIKLNLRQMSSGKTGDACN